MRFILALFFMMSFIFLEAQPRPVKAAMEYDPEADKYLKSIKLKLEKLKGYKMFYTTEIVDADRKKQIQKGSYLGSGERYVIDVPDMQTINNGITQWTIDKVGKEIQIVKPSKSRKGKIETPLDIIKDYKSMFKYRVKEPLNNNIIVLELVPINKNSNYFKVDLTIDAAKNTISSAKLYDRGGHRIQFHFTKMQEFRQLSNAQFSLDTTLFKGYEILDMR